MEASVAEQTQQTEPAEAQPPVAYEVPGQQPESTDETPEPDTPAVEPPVTQSGRITLHCGLTKDVVDIAAVADAFGTTGTLTLEDPGGREFHVLVAEIALYE